MGRLNDVASIQHALFLALGLIGVVFALSFKYEFLFRIGFAMILLMIIAILVELFLLYLKGSRFEVDRNMSKLLSLGDDNLITIQIKSHYNYLVHVELIDELPVQLQERDFGMKFSIDKGETKELKYNIHPNKRGKYRFGSINILVCSALGLARRKISMEMEEEVQVFPSIIQMKKYELIAFAKISTHDGLKKSSSSWT